MNASTRLAALCSAFSLFSSSSVTGRGAVVVVDVDDADGERSASKSNDRLVPDALGDPGVEP